MYMKRKGIQIAANVDILNPTKVTVSSSNTSIGLPVVRGGIHTIKGGAIKLTDCPNANNTLITALGAASSVLSLTEIVDILGSIETDFNCASLCKRSNIFAFSDVSRGPPPQTCRRSITTLATHISRVFFLSSVVFGVVSLLGFIYAVILTFQKDRELEEPLLH
jgi:hypothetical protein